MAGERLSWVFEIQDKLSGAAGRMGKALRGVEASLHAGDRAARTFAGGLHKIVETGFYVTGLIRNIGSFVSGLAGKIANFGKHAIDVVTFRENALIGLRAIMGSQKEATKLVGLAEQIANRVGQSDETFVAFARDLARAGMNAREVAKALKAAGDVAPLGIDPSAFVGALSEMFSMEQVPSKMIRGLKGVGIELSSVYKHLADPDLAKEAGIDPSENIRDLVEGVAAEKMISSQTVIKAVMRSLTDMEGKIGSLGEQAGSTPGAALQRFQNKLDDSLKNLAGGKGMAAITGVINNLSKVLGKGGFLEALVNGPVAKFLEQFTGPDGSKKIQDAFQGVTDAIVSTADALARLMGLVGIAQPGGKKAPPGLLDKLTAPADAAFKITHPGASPGGLAPGGGFNPFNWGAIMDHYSLPAGQGVMAPKASVPKGATGAVFHQGSIQVNVDARGAHSPEEVGDATAGALAAILQRVAVGQGVA